METIKSAIGLGGKSEQEGQEPVSGQGGEGTAAEPYDSGNVQGKLYRYQYQAWTTDWTLSLSGVTISHTYHGF